MSVEQLIQNYGSQQVIDILSSHLTENRIQRIDQVVENRICSVHVAIEAPYDFHNAMAIVRSAEAMGVNNVHIISSELRKNSGKKTAGGTKNWVNISRYQEFSPFYESMQTANMLLAGASPRGPTPLNELPTDKPICLLFGNEQRGLTDEALGSCNTLFHIPMYGVAESYNLSVSGAICLYDLLQRKRASMESSGDLDENQKLMEKARYYIRTLGFKGSSAILRGCQ